MELQEIAPAFDPWRKLHKRHAWRPVVRGSHGSPSDSKFGGIPYLDRDEEWPTCGCCGRPMQFFLQLNLSRLPRCWRDEFDGGLLQFFQCSASGLTDAELCDEKLAAYCSVASNAKILRVVRPRSRTPALPPKALKLFPPRSIVKWQRFDDFPSDREHESLGLEYNYEHHDDFSATIDVAWKAGHVEFKGLREAADPGDDQVSFMISRAASGDKLGGWPKWVQSTAHPRCPRCDCRMRYIFQIDSKDNLPHMFGDMGCGRITQCPDHRDVIAFTCEGC